MTCIFLEYIDDRLNLIFARHRTGKMESRFKHTSVSDLESELRKQKDGPKFEFVTISNPTDIKNRSVQQKIRRHAGQAGTQPSSRRRQQTALVLEVSSPLPKHLGLSSRNPENTSKYSNRSELDFYVEFHSSTAGSQRVLQSLGMVWGLKPKASYSVNLDPGSLTLVEFRR
jgi:hypothetical protein